MKIITWAMKLFKIPPNNNTEAKKNKEKWKIEAIIYFDSNKILY